MHLQESGEMYLETILILSRKSQFVRSIDISEYMNFSKPSVSRAIGLLKEGGYITVDVSGYISLTDAGAEIAGKIYERHNVLTEFLKEIERALVKKGIPAIVLLTERTVPAYRFYQKCGFQEQEEQVLFAKAIY